MRCRLVVMVGCDWICGYAGMWDRICGYVIGSVIMLDVVRSVAM